jgi:hypothetical protein
MCHPWNITEPEKQSAKAAKCKKTIANEKVVMGGNATKASACGAAPTPSTATTTIVLKYLIILYISIHCGSKTPKAR